MTLPAPTRPLRRALRATGGLAVALAVLLGALVVPAPAQARAVPDDGAPLRVSLETLRPGVIPERGRVRLTGRITNRSQETWTDLSAYLVTSDTPLRTREELAAAAGTESTAAVGTRRTSTGLYTEVGDLAPGESVPYRLSVRRPDLGISGEPGVYWVGVHVLGTNGDGRDSVADGRARTFIPLMPASGTAAATRDRTRLALLVPVKRPVARGSAGRLLDAGSWNAALAAGGRLDRLLSLTARARAPMSWVVDPAVLDAVRSIARGNPPLEPDPSVSPAPSPSSSPSSSPSTRASPSPSDGGTPTHSAGQTGDGQATTPEQDRARLWMEQFREQAPRHTVLSVPYGNLDVAAVVDGGTSSLYELGVTLSKEALEAAGVDSASPVVAPPSGVLPEAARQQLDPLTALVLRGGALPGADRAVTRRPGTSPVVLADPDAEGGGPSPNSRYAALPVRQRLLSDAALHAMSAGRDDPLVVSMPEYWNPGDAWGSSQFFSALDEPWLDLVDLPTVIASAPVGRGSDPLEYPQADRAAQVPAANLAASRELVVTAGTYQGLVRTDTPVEDRLDRIALLTSSIAARSNPAVSRLTAARTTRYVRSRMARVRVEGPEFVMMSGEEGPIQVSLVNGLDQPVRVGITVTTSGTDLHIADIPPVTLGPGGRSSVRLTARSADIGVHAVTLTATNDAGVPIGPGTQVTVRTSNVSQVIWVVMAVGGGILLVAIVVRLLRRVQRRRATHGPRATRRSEA